MTTVAQLQARLESPGATRRLTSAALVDVPSSSGKTVRVAMGDPAELAAKAGLSREAYALARCIQSEGYGGARVGKAAAAVAIGQAVRNNAKRVGTTIEALLTQSKFIDARGRFGEQSGRYAATTLDPTAWAGEVAVAVLEDGLPDLARGAHKFVDPQAFVRGEQAGKALQPFETVMRSWVLTDGNVYRGPIPTVDPFHLVTLGRATPSTDAVRRRSLAELLDIYEAGKAGRSSPAPGDPDAMTSNALLGGLVVAVAAAWAAWKGIA